MKKNLIFIIFMILLVIFLLSCTAFHKDLPVSGTRTDINLIYTFESTLNTLYQISSQTNLYIVDKQILRAYNSKADYMWSYTLSSKLYKFIINKNEELFLLTANEMLILDSKGNTINSFNINDAYQVRNIYVDEYTKIYMEKSSKLIIYDIYGNVLSENTKKFSNFPFLIKNNRMYVNGYSEVICYDNNQSEVWKVPINYIYTFSYKDDKIYYIEDSTNYDYNQKSYVNKFTLNSIGLETGNKEMVFTINTNVSSSYKSYYYDKIFFIKDNYLYVFSDSDFTIYDIVKKKIFLYKNIEIEKYSCFSDWKKDIIIKTKNFVFCINFKLRTKWLYRSEDKFVVNEFGKNVIIYKNNKLWYLTNE